MTPGNGYEISAAFHIDKIIFRKTQRKKEFYLIKWKGYDDKYSTWESVNDILTPLAIDEFKKNWKQQHVKH